MGTLIVRPVLKETARRLILAGHYSHKWQPTFGIYSFGIFREGQEEEEQCLGVAAFGWMKNPKAKIFISSVPNGWMIELNRMWIDDSLGKNAETILIGASLRLLKKLDPTIVAVQSFADGRIGCGTIYKASNFRYFGSHYTTFIQNRRSGEISHEQNLTNSTCASGFCRGWAWILCGDATAFRVRTHRYIFPLHKSFRYIGPGNEQPYPAYSKGTDPVELPINAVLLRERLLRTLDVLIDRYPHKRSPK